MKKLWLKVVVAVVVLAGLGVGLVLLNINPILDSLRPEIQRTISSKVGQPVTLGGLSLKLFPSVAVEVSDIRLEGAAAGGGIKTLTLKTKLKPLLSRQLLVEEAGIEGLDVRVIRKADGSITLNGIPADSKSKTPAEPTEEAGGEKKAAVAVSVKSSWIKNSRVTWEDETISPKVEVSIENISADFKDITDRGVAQMQIGARLFGKNESNLVLSGGGGTSGSFKAAWNEVVLSQLAALARAYGVKLEPLEVADTMTLGASVKMPPAPGGDVTVNVELNGTGARIVYGPHFHKERNVPFVLQANIAAAIGDILGGSIKSDDIHLKLGEIAIDLPLVLEPFQRQLQLKVKTAKFPLAGLSNLVPAVKPYELKGELPLDISVQMLDGKLHTLGGGAELKGVSLVAPRDGKDGLPISGISGRIALTKDTVVLQPTKLSVFDGGATVEGNLSADKKFLVQVQGSGLDLTKISAFLGLGKVSMTGKLSSLAVRLAGPSTGFAEQMTGSISAEAVKGTIEGFNILGQTLGKITEIPGLGGALLGLVSEKHRPLVEMNATSFEKLTVGATLAGKNITLTNVILEHPQYKVTGGGEIKASGDMEIRTQLRLMESLTGGMTEKQPKLKLLLDPTKAIVLPVVVVRKDGTVLVLPDVSHLGKLALGNTARDAASKALEKVAPGLGEKIAPGIGNALDSLFK